MISVAAAVIFKNGKVLIARRSNEKHLAGYWEFPGGKIEPNETPEECLIREIAEELNIDIQVNSFLKENVHDYSDKQILLKAYRCTYCSGDLMLSDHDAVEWVHPEELLNFRLAPADIPFVAALLSN